MRHKAVGFIQKHGWCFQNMTASIRGRSSLTSSFIIYNTAHEREVDTMALDKLDIFLS